MTITIWSERKSPVLRSPNWLTGYGLTVIDSSTSFHSPPPPPLVFAIMSFRGLPWCFFFCFNHTVFTLLRVWQPLSPLRLRAGRLDGGAPLLLPVVPFWQKKESIQKWQIYIIQRKRDEIKESPPDLTPPPPFAHRLLLLRRPLPAGSCSSARFGQEFPDIRGRQEVHHRLIAFLYGEQLRDFHVSASARSPSRRFSHLFPERILLVFPSAAMAEEMFSRLGCPASAATPPAFVIVSLSEPF